MRSIERALWSNFSRALKIAVMNDVSALRRISSNFALRHESGVQATIAGLFSEGPSTCPSNILRTRADSKGEGLRKRRSAPRVVTERKVQRNERFRTPLELSHTGIKLPRDERPVTCILWLVLFFFFHSSFLIPRNKSTRIFVAERAYIHVYIYHTTDLNKLKSLQRLLCMRIFFDYHSGST